MKVGSIVICLTDSYKASASVYWPNGVPVKDSIVTVRSIEGTNILFEEFVNPPHFHCGDREPTFGVRYFREIEFPPALTESIQECLTRELEVVK